MTIPDSAVTAELLQSISLLIRANHILHKYDLVDAFGHISIRHPQEPSQYIIAAYDPGAPALVASRKDFIVYYISDSTSVHENQPQGYSERYIHGELFKKYPEAQCVIHSHSAGVLPFTAFDMPAKPVYHMAAFLGSSGPRSFNITPIYNRLQEEQNKRPNADGHKVYDADMLIKTPALGAALAEAFEEDIPVLFQQKHGFTCWGTSIQEAVYHAVYTERNCEILQSTIALGSGDLSKIRYLTEEEVSACTAAGKKCQDKAWRLWIREVQVNPLYRIEECEPAALRVAGMKV